MPNTSNDFKTFWDAYGLKRDRRRAESAWNRLSAKDRRAAMAGIVPYRTDCQKRGISMMYAQGYLNNRRWEDEFEDAEPAAAVQEKVSPKETPAVPQEMDLW